VLIWRKGLPEPEFINKQTSKTASRFFLCLRENQRKRGTTNLSKKTGKPCKAFRAGKTSSLT
jgi:hypothetical protein